MPANRPSLSSIRYDHSGWRIYDESAVHQRWRVSANAAVMVQFFDIAPTSPFDTTMCAEAEASYEDESRENGGVMLSLTVEELAGTAALRGLFKYRLPGPHALGLYYVGILLFQFADFSFRINTESWEQGTSGLREAAVAAMNPAAMLRSDQEPIKISSTKELFAALHASPLRPTAADSEEYDQLFPEHPLSQVRELQRHFIATLQLDDAIRAGQPYRYRA